MAFPTRRRFVQSSIAAAPILAAAAQASKQITSASIAEDPIAPAVSQGTQAAYEPFSSLEGFSQTGVPARVAAFAPGEIKLLPGEFLDAQELDRNYLQSLPAARLLHNFRLNVGIPSSAEPLGGWEKPDCELRGHFVGHFLSGCARMYASTGDREMKSKGDEVVAGLAECQSKSSTGYVSAFPLELFDRLRSRVKVWAPFYTIHKIMAGLVDMHQLCANQQALIVLKGMAGWTDDWTRSLSEPQMQMVLDTEYGGMNDVLYLLAGITGDAHWGTVGDRFTKKRFFNPLANHRDELRGLHANTHIPQVIGAARRYQMTGDQRFREVADYFYTAVTESRAYVTGGTSNNEGWLTGPNRLAEELKQGTDTTECCCAYNMMKLATMLHSWTAESHYLDYFERTLYNHRLGTIQKDGAMQYYLGIAPGAWRTFSTRDASFWCCDGTGVEEYANLGASIYSHDASGIYINLFIPSELHPASNMVHLRQETSFPDEPVTRLIFKAPATTTLHIRIPAWCPHPVTVKLNGTPLETLGTPGSYFAIRRSWSKGDMVEVELPMELRYEAMPDDPGLRAILYGPLVLAAGLGNEGLSSPMVLGPEGPEMDKHPASTIPSFNTGSKRPAEWLQKTGPLTFTATSAGKPLHFLPLHRLSGQRYSIYWRINQTSEI